MSNNNYSSFDSKIPVTSSDTSLKKAASKYDIPDASSPITTSVSESTSAHSALEVDVPAGLLSNQFNVDHIISDSKGGKTEMSNLQTLCRDFENVFSKVCTA